MYIWIIIVLSIGATVAVFLALLSTVLCFSTKSWINKGKPIDEPAGEEQKSQNVVVTDPFSGKLMNLERVSNASSLRSTKSIGFIAYDNSVSSSNHPRGRVTPLFHAGSIRSVRSNKSVSTSAGSINQELKTMNVNPLYREDAKSEEPQLGNSRQMRARGLIFE